MLKFIVMIFIIIYFIYQLVISLLNLKSTKETVPENLKDIYKENEYQKYLSYTKEKEKLQICKNSALLVLSLILFLTPIFSIVGNISSNIYVSGILVLVFYNLVETIAIIPFMAIDNFKVEGKYGFNRMTKKTFIIDRIKDFIISSIILISLGMLFTLFYLLFNIYSVLILSGTLIIIMIIIMIISPKLVSINNKKVPLEEGELRTELESLLTSQGYQVKDIYVIDGSRRSSKANAFFTGTGKLKSIMLYDTLVDLMTPREIAAVFAHELGHGKHHDVNKGMILSIINIILLVSIFFVITYFFKDLIFTDYGFNTYALAFIIILGSETILPIYSTIFGIISNKISRKHEYAADKMAKDLGYGNELISALKKLTVNNYSNLTPNKFVVAMEYSHPPIRERIGALG